MITRILAFTFLLSLFACTPERKEDVIAKSYDLQFVTKTKDKISVKEEPYFLSIYYNDKLIYKDTLNYSLVINNINRIIEGDGSSVSLFLLIDGSPNFNRIVGYEIKNNSAILKSDACFYGDGGRKDGPAPFTDIDNDGFIEYGGFDITEVPYSYPDSIYYNPGEFFEIRNGNIFFDTILTKMMNIKENGIFLEHYLDQEGNCCIIIPNPYKK